MIYWTLVDKDGNEFGIDDSIYTAFRKINDDFSVEVDSVERSSQPGSEFTGIQRDESKKLEFTYQLFFQSNISYDLVFNTLTYWLRKTVKIKDIITGVQTDVRYTGQKKGYIEGSYKRGANLTIEFEQSMPFWESITTDTTSTTLTDGGQIIINNEGFIESPPTLTLTADNGAITKFSIRISETGDGVIINDPQFGLINLSTYVIENKTGQFLLNGLDRKAKIKAPTGPFKLQPGINTIIFEFLGTMIIKIDYNKRFYI